MAVASAGPYANHLHLVRERQPRQYSNHNRSDNKSNLSE